MVPLPCTLNKIEKHSQRLRLRKQNLLHIPTTCNFIRKIFALVFDVLNAQIDLAHIQFLVREIVSQGSFVMIQLAVQGLEGRDQHHALEGIYAQLLLGLWVDWCAGFVVCGCSVVQVLKNRIKQARKASVLKKQVMRWLPFDEATFRMILRILPTL